MDTKRLLQLIPRTFFALVAMLVMMGLQTVVAQTIYVSSTTGSDAFNGATPTISGGNGPKQTLAAAIAAAASGSTISIEAGTYNEVGGFDFSAAKNFTVEVRAAGAVTVANFTAGIATINPGAGRTITLNSGAGSVTVSGAPVFTLTTGTLALGAGKLNFSAPTALNVTAGRASGASPGYTGAVTATYTFPAAGSAGTEIPASLNAGGTLTVNGGFATTFPAALSAPAGITVNNTNTTTFTGAVSVSGAANVVMAGGAEDVVFSSTLALGNGGVFTTAGGVTPTFTVNGDLSYSQNFANQGGSVNNAAGVTMALASLTVNSTITGAGNAASNPLAFGLNNAGTLTVAGAVADNDATDADETDSGTIAFTNLGTATFNGTFVINGGVTNGNNNIAFNQGATVAGIFNSASAAPQAIALGANTLTLTGPVALADDFDLGRVTGATSTVSITGTNHLGTGNTQGAVTMSGSGNINGAVVVGGALSLLDDNDVVGSIDVAGNATLGNAAGDVINFLGGAPTNDIDGAVTVGGTVALVAGGAGNVIFGSGSVSSTGSFTINNGATLTVNGDWNTSNGGVFVANALNNSAADNATLAFSIARGATATYTPGPNTSIDDFTFAATGLAGTATLNIGQSFAIDENFTTGANTNVSLGNYLVRVSGTTAIASVNGTITTPAGLDGAIAFEGAAQSLNGLGLISNILINVGAGNTLAIPGAGPVTTIQFTGQLNLFTGGIAVAGASEIKPTGTTAEVRRNSAAGAATTVITGNFNTTAPLGTYVLTVYGGGTVIGGSELAASGVTTLNVIDAGTDYATGKAATVGNVNVAFGAVLGLTNTFDLTVTGVVTNAGSIDRRGGAPDENLILAGDNLSHSNTGTIDATLWAMASGITVTGSATIRTAAPLVSSNIRRLVVGDNVVGTGAESITFVNLQQINNSVVIDTDGSATIGLVQDDGDIATGNGNEGRVGNNITVANGGSLTWTTNARLNGNVTVGTAPVGAAPTFNFNGNTAFMINPGATFLGNSNANFGTTGDLEIDAVGVGVGTNQDLAVAPTSALPGLDVDAASGLVTDTRVTGASFFDAGFGGGFNLTMAGTVYVNAPITNNVIINGTTITLAGSETLFGNLTLNAATVAFQGDGVAGNNPDDWTVAGLYTHTAGAVSLTGIDVITTGGFTYVAGTYTATAATDSRTTAPAGDFMVLNGGALTIGATPLSIPNVEVRTGTAVAVGDVFTAGEFLWLSGGNLTATGAGAAPIGTINLGDGAAGFYLDTAGFNVVRGAGVVPGVVAYGSDYTTTGTLEYSAPTALTSAEIPATFGTLIVKGATAFGVGVNSTVNTIVFDAPLAIENGAAGNESLTLAAGGNVFVGVDDVFGANERFAPADALNFTVQFDGASTTTGNFGGGNTSFWGVAGWQPSVVIAGGAPVALHANRTACGLTTTGAGSVMALGANSLTVRCNVNTTAGAASITTAGGSLIFGGTTAQTLTGGLNLTNVTVNNAAGLTLVGGNLNTSGVASGAVCPVASNTLILTAGVITTGANRVIICHNSTTNQGFVRTTGGVYGNVQVTVTGINAVAPFTLNPDRVEFPLVDQGSNDREFAITFNAPHQLNSNPTLVANQVDASAGGTNGLPISTTDLVGGAFQVGRYPSFHWNVMSTPTVTPSIDYDVEYRAAGYANFVTENIEHTRGIRRQAGSTSNFWILTSPTPADNDNYAVSGTQPVIVGRNAVGAIGSDGVLFTFGLEQNFMATNPAALVMNAGQTRTIDLTTVFSGGSPNPAAPTYAYAVATGSAATATGATGGTNTLTVTGVAAGTTTITVTGTDTFGATATATVNVTVNPVLAVGSGIASYARNVGAAAMGIGTGGSFTGGTAPIVITAVSSNPATASVVVGVGQITVTHGVVGTANITLTATDATGATAAYTFTITINAGLAVNAGILVNKTLVQGTNDGGQTVVGAFAGGTGAYTYGATSGNTGVATVALAGTTVTATGVGPYVIVGGAVTADAAPATVSVTATDVLGATATATYTVTVNPKPGNVSGAGPDPASANLTLNNFLGLQALTPKQTLAANFNGDASVTPFDAALIFNAWLAGKREFVINPMAELAYGEVGVNGVNAVVPVRITGEASEVVSFAYSAIVDPTVAKVTSVTSNVEGWTVAYSTLEDGTVQIAGYGLEALPADGIVATINVTLLNEGTEFALAGQAAVNANAASEIGGVTVGELPENFSLLGNYPNPFNPSTTISFDLPASAEVTVQVFDMLGRQVLVLPAQTIQGGAKRSVQLNGSNLASGSYFYRVIAKMDSKTAVENGRMLLVK